MTLTDLIDPRNLAKWLGIDPDGEIQVRAYSWDRRSWSIKTITGVQHASQWMDDYRKQLNADWLKSKDNPWKHPTWDNFIRECLRKGVGVKKGTTAAMRQQAIAARPDLFSAV